MPDERVNTERGALPKRLHALAALKADFRIAVLFDSQRCEGDAHLAMWRLLNRIRPGVRIDVRFWQCGTIKQHTDWEYVHSDLAGASAVIIASEGAIGLRCSVARSMFFVATETQAGELVVAVRDRGLPFLVGGDGIR